MDLPRADCVKGEQFLSEQCDRHCEMGGKYVIEVNCAKLYSLVFASVIWL